MRQALGAAGNASRVEERNVFGRVSEPVRASGAGREFACAYAALAAVEAQANAAIVIHET